MRLLEEVGPDLERAELIRSAAVRPHAAAASSAERSTCSAASIGSCRNLRPVSRKTSGSPVVRKRYAPSRASSFSIPFRASVSATSRAVSSAEKTSVTPAEDPLEDRADERIVRAAEDHRVHARLLERRGVLADGRGLLAEGVVALDERDEPRAGDGDDLRSRVERADELRVAAAGDGRLGGEEADPAVARREDGGMRLRGEDADHGHGELKLEIRERRGRGRVAGGDDELDAAALEVARDLGGEPTDLLEGTGPVREAGAVAEVDEISCGSVTRHSCRTVSPPMPESKTPIARESIRGIVEAGPDPTGRERRLYPGSVVRAWLVAVAAALVLVAGEAPGASFARQELSIPMDDGTSIAATLYVPDEAMPGGGWPAIVFLHGLAGDRRRRT